MTFGIVAGGVVVALVFAAGAYLGYRRSDGKIFRLIGKDLHIRHLERKNK